MSSRYGSLQFFFSFTQNKCTNKLESGYVKLIAYIFLQGAPHPPSLVMSDTWTKPYSREYAAFPASWLREAKFWPTTGNISFC
jgi:hypothetical protein